MAQGLSADIEWRARFPETAALRVPRRKRRPFRRPPLPRFPRQEYTYRRNRRLVRRAAKGFAALGVRPRRARRADAAQHALITSSPISPCCKPAASSSISTRSTRRPRSVTSSRMPASTIMVTLDLQAALRVGGAADRPDGPAASSSSARWPTSCRSPKAGSIRLLKRSDIAPVPRDGAHIGFDELIANDGVFTPVAVDPARDLAVLQYTGGTTGTPKGAMLTHSNLTANALQCVRWFPGMERGQRARARRCCRSSMSSP